MKKFMFVSMMVFVVFMIACASNQQTGGNSSKLENSAGEPSVRPGTTFLCDEFSYDTPDEFRCMGIVYGYNTQQGELMQNALIDAQEECKRKISHFVEGMSETWRDRYGNNKGNDFRRSAEEAMVEYWNDIMNNTDTKCRRISETLDENEKVHVYTVIAVPKKVVVNTVANKIENSVSEEEKKDMQFEKHEFLEKLDEKAKAFEEKIDAKKKKQ